MGAWSSKETGQVDNLSGKAAGVAAAAPVALRGVLDTHAKTRDAYQLALAQHAKALGVTGAGEAAAHGGYFGGDLSESPSKTLKNYSESLAAATKNQYARGLARALSRAGFDVDPEASLEDIAAKLKKVLPDPHNKRTFPTDAKKQENICKTIADVLNDEFTPGAPAADRLIDSSLGPVSVCRQVAELVHSFSVGLHTEFLEVHASLTRIVRDLEVLDEALGETHAHIVGKVAKQGDAELGRAVEPLDEIYRRVQAERSRQLMMLKNFLKITLAPAREELAIAMQGESESYEMLQRLKLVPGTGAFADSLAQAISGMGTIAAVTARVDKALREVGMGVGEYVTSSDMSALEAELDKKLYSGKVSADDVGKFLRSVQTLKENFYRREELDFASDLAKAAAGDKKESVKKEGGAEKSDLDRRIETRKAERKLIVKGFIDKSARRYSELLKAIKEIGPHLGKEIPLSDRLEMLRNTLARLSDSSIGAMGLELALIGFFNDAASREKKETFIANLKVVKSIIDEIMALEMYRASGGKFAAMREAIDGLVQTIDYYSDVIQKKYGGDVDEAPGADEKVGGAIPDELVSLPEIARSGYDLNTAVNTFLYFYYVAKVRENLAQSHKELEYYGEKYDEVLGDAVAARLRDIANQHKTDVAAIETAYNAMLPADQTPVRKANRDEAIALLGRMHECKQNFYRALQALDLYMKAFTDGVSAHPDDVKDIRQMLGEVEVIGRWFSEETGDSLAYAFEQMPDELGRAKSQVGDLDDADHYYVRVAEVAEDANHIPGVGIPYMSQTPTRAVEVQKRIDKTYDNFQALKNIVNAFARIGARFGGKELKRAAFMSPTQMYHVFVDYLKKSALTIKQDNAVINAEVYNGQNKPTTHDPAGASPLGSAFDNLTAVYFSPTGLSAARWNVDPAFKTENMYFVYCIKAMAAKILTVIGVYDLFERPSPVYDLTPTRMIIGGAEYGPGYPDIIPGAAELYFRLPRLVEFYRDLFAFNEGGEELQISMIPEVEGVFSKLITQIFVRTDYSPTDSGTYSDIELTSLVQNINRIYEHYRETDGENANRAALNGFVMEINRRYGVVKKSDWTKHKQLWIEQRRGADDLKGSLNQTNYAILPGEGEEYESDLRRAPSDRFLGPAAAGQLQVASKYAIDTAPDGRNISMLREFRIRLDKMFSAVKPEDFTANSFATLIEQGRREIVRNESSEHRFQVVSRLIQGSDTLASVDLSKSLLFHETVIAPLNVLTAVYTLLNSCRANLIALDAPRFRKIIKDWMLAGAGGAVNKGTIEAEIGRVIDKMPEHPAGTRLSDKYISSDAGTLNGRGGTVHDAAMTYAVVYQWGQAHVGAGANPAAAAENTMARNAVARFALDTDYMMEDLFTILYGLTADFQGLVQVTFPSTQAAHIHLDFRGLRGLIEQTMANVRHFIDVLRPHIAKSVLKRYEDMRQPGSLYWLEKHLLDGFVRGRSDDQTLMTFEWMSSQVNKIYGELIGDTGVSLDGIVENGGTLSASPVVIADGARKWTHFDQYGATFARIIYYDGGADESGLPAAIADGAAYGAGSRIEKFIRVDVDARGQSVRPVGSGLPVNAASALDLRLQLWSERPGLQENRSMMMTFNQLVAKYLATFTENIGGKIYRNLIDSFANGTLSRSIMFEGTSMPDLARVTAAGGNAPTFGHRGDPTSSGVLSQSLAMILKNLVREVNRNTQTSDHLVSTLSEVPLYIRESFRANLPTFVKLFELVQREGDLAKRLITQTPIQMGRTWSARSVFDGSGVGLAAPVYSYSATAGAANQGIGGSQAYGTNAFQSSVIPLGDMADLRMGEVENIRNKVIEIIDSVTTGCYALASASEDVLRELADEPLYLETHENSIQEYKARFGKAPLMPLSLSAIYLKDDAISALPENPMGSLDFKFMYGTRKLLGRPSSKITLDDVPGARANLEMFNATASDRETIDPKRFEGFVTTYVALLRYVVDTRRYRGVISPVNAGSEALQVPLTTTEAELTGRGDAEAMYGYLIVDGPRANTVFSIRESVAQEVIEVVENGYQDERLRKIGAIASGAGSLLGSDRAREWTMNIIDMNIIPINIHALMRGIPFAPIYNYAFTFEQMVCLMFGEDYGRVSSLDPGQNDLAHPTAPKTSLQFFLAMLNDPYAPVDRSQYGSDALRGGAFGYLSRVMRGDSSLMMGRPKFIGDQVWNKALFGSLVPSVIDMDEGGPRASAAVRRGRDNMPSDALVPGVLGDNITPAGTVVGTFNGTMRMPPANAAPQPSDSLSVRRLANLGRVRNFPGDVVDPQRGVEGTQAGMSVLTFLAGESAGAPAGMELYTRLKQVSLGAADTGIKKTSLTEYHGRMRFDTQIVRNLFFLTNVQRLIRLKLNQELTQYRNVLVSSHSVVNPGVTEYGYMPSEPNPGGSQRRVYPGENESYEDRKYDSDRRLVA